MNNLTKKAYFRHSLGFSTILMICSMTLPISFGDKGEYLPIFQFATMFFVPLFLLQHCYLLFAAEKSEQSFKLSILTGSFSGIVMTLAARVGLVLNYFLWSPDKKMLTLIRIFVDFWQLYLLMALFGILCMSIEPFFRIVLHKELFKNPKPPSRFWTKYSPSALIMRFVFRKDLSERNNTDSADKY